MLPSGFPPNSPTEIVVAIIFYGPNRIFANALDDNLYDYIRSQSIQQGGSTFSPGEIPTRRLSKPSTTTTLRTTTTMAISYSKNCA